MRYKELLSVRGTSLLLLVGLMLVNRFILSDHVLRLTRRWDLLMSFFLKRDSECEDVFSEIALLDKIFKVLTEGPALRSLMSSAIMEGAVFFL